MPSEGYFERHRGHLEAMSLVRGSHMEACVFHDPLGLRRSTVYRWQPDHEPWLRDGMALALAHPGRRLGPPELCAAVDAIEDLMLALLWWLDVPEETE